MPLGPRYQFYSSCKLVLSSVHWTTFPQKSNMLIEASLPCLPPSTNHSLANWRTLYASGQHRLISSCSTSCLSDSASSQNMEIPNSFFRSRPTTPLMSKTRGLPQFLIFLCVLNNKYPSIDPPTHTQCPFLDMLKPK